MFFRMTNFETGSDDLTKGLTEMLMQKMTASAWSVLVGVFGAMLCCLWGSGVHVGVSMGFSG